MMLLDKVYRNLTGVVAHGGSFWTIEDIRVGDVVFGAAGPGSATPGILRSAIRFSRTSFRRYYWLEFRVDRTFLVVPLILFASGIELDACTRRAGADDVW
jgi:hypothetical protein